MNKITPNINSLYTALVAALAIGASSALYAVMTPVIRNLPVAATPEIPRIQPSVPGTGWFQAPETLIGHSESLKIVYEDTFHLDPSLRHRLMYRELREKVNVPISAGIAIESSSEFFVSLQH